MDKEDRATFMELLDAAMESLDDEDLTADEQGEIRERWLDLMRKLLKQEKPLEGAPSPSESLSSR